jgi:dihydrofolate reductase
MPIALIAAAAGEKLVIGRNGDLPWHFSEDLKYFKEKTMGHPVLMGRKTYQSILKRLGKPLPGRRNIVLTHDKGFHDGRIETIHDTADISKLAGKGEWLFIIGGETVYKATMSMGDMLYLTHIGSDFEGDAFFPPISKKEWKLTEEHHLDEKGVRLSFRTYERKKNPV